jgi:pimeloyl-ACP methyl ester carboxylesterase
MPASRTLDVPGAHLRYEVRGDGPLLLLLGAPMPAAPFAPLADALASDHTVVTADPRGISGSTLDDPSRTRPRTCGPTTSPPSSTTWGPGRPTCSAAAAGR